MKEHYVENLGDMVGLSINDVFYCTQITKKMTDTNAEYCEFQLQDRTGIVCGKLWESVSDEIQNLLHKAILVKGMVMQEQSKIMIVLLSIHEIMEQEWEYHQLFNGITVEVQTEYQKELMHCVQKVEDANYKALLERLFTPEFISTFSQIPGSIKKNHYYNGGLLVYSVSMALTSWRMRSYFELHDQNPMYSYLYNKDLIITASLSHAVGFVQELEPLPVRIRKEASFYLPTVDISIQMIGKLMEGIPFSEAKKGVLLHTIEAIWKEEIKPICMEGALLHSVRQILMQRERMSYFYYHHTPTKMMEHTEYSSLLNNYLYFDQYSTNQRKGEINEDSRK